MSVNELEKIHVLLTRACKHCGGRRVVTYIPYLRVEMVTCENCDRREDSP